MMGCKKVISSSFITGNFSKKFPSSFFKYNVFYLKFSEVE